MKCDYRVGNNNTNQILINVTVVFGYNLKCINYIVQ